MGKILFARSSVEPASEIAKHGFDPMSKFKLHGNSRVTAAGAAGHEYIDISNGTSSFTTLQAYYSSFDFDLFVHTGHGLPNSMWGDYDSTIDDYNYVAYLLDAASLTPMIGKAVYGFCCDAYTQVIYAMYAYGAVAIAGYNRPYWYAYDPAEQAELTDTIFTSFMNPGFKFVESVIAGNTWSQAGIDTKAEFDAQIEYWETGAGSGNVNATVYAALINDNKGMFGCLGTFQITGAVPTTGTINVTTNNSSATFSLAGAASYSGSGTTWIQEDATAGSYTITYGDVAGYTKPANETKTLTAGETISFTGTYTPVVTTGTINVTTNLSAATFTLTGAASYSGSGTSWTQASATAGQYTITYGAVAGYNTPPAETKTLVAGSSIAFSATYTAVSTDGTINVTTNSDSAIFTIMGPETFIGSGSSWSDNSASPGVYTIVFNQLVGYVTPESQSGILAAGGTLSFTGTYVAEVLGGTINVSTNLSSATFTLTGPETLTGSGTTWSEDSAAAGDYTITYGAVAGYTTPASETKTLSNGGSITFTGTYSAAASVGTIAVSTNNASATFTVFGPAVYSGSGTSWTQTNAPTGVYMIIYGNVAGYSTPPNDSLTLTSGSTITFTGTYASLSASGTISVSCNNDSASYTITGTNTYTGTGRSNTHSSAPTGSYTIVFGAVAGYSTPASQTASLSSGGTLTFTGIYIAQSNVTASTYDDIIEVGGDLYTATMGGLIKSVTDPINHYRMEHSPTQVAFSALPIIPGLGVDSHLNIIQFNSLYDVDTTNKWSVKQSGSGTGLTIQDERGGLAKFINGPADDDYYSYFSLYEFAKLSSGKGLWISTGIRIKDVDEADWFYGLCLRVVAGANIFDNRIDSLGFYGTDGSANINIECRKDYVSTQTTGISTLTDSTFVMMDIYVEGTARVFFYINGRYQANILTNIPDDEQLCIAFGCRNGKREANEFSIYQIKLIQNI